MAQFATYVGKTQWAKLITDDKFVALYSEDFYKAQARAYLLLNDKVKPNDP